MIKKMLLGMVILLALLETAQAQYPGWRHSGSVYLLTTPEGANLPASASEDGFVLLVRLHKDFFNFSQAKAKGEDIRFSTSTGTSLAYQIEEWNPANGTASIWVRIPTIKGNARQEIQMYWGKADAASESKGSVVFNESNGYLSVWHMNEPVKDEVGTITSKDEGTTAIGGIVGQARHLAGKQGISGGESITNYPSGTGPMTTEAWFRAEKPNSTVLAWGKEQRPGKVMMNFLSPPHIAIQCYFAPMNVYTMDESEFFEGFDYQTRHEEDVLDFYIGTSRDGVNFDKSWIYARKPLVPRGPAGSFDKDGAFPPSQIVTHKDEHWIYYGGASERHYSIGRDMKIGLAKLRLDGFICLEAKDTPGTVITKAFKLEGDKLEANVDAKDGWVQIELLDENSKAIPGFSGKAAKKYKGVDELRLKPQWKSGGDLSQLKPKTVKLRFTLKNARLYSFSFTHISHVNRDKRTEF